MFITPIVFRGISKQKYPVLNKDKQTNSCNHAKKVAQVFYTPEQILAFKGLEVHHFLPNNNHVKISFCGYPVHIVDGSNHATNVAHFAKAIEKNMDIEMHEVLVTPKDKNVKNLKSLEAELKKLNSSSDLHHGDYVAVPALASVSLLNLKDRIRAIEGRDVTLTAETVKVHKPLILKVLKKIYENPDKYSKEIGYMDPQEQGIEYTYGVIQELNKLKTKGAKVYVPAGHPHDDSIKWLAGQRGLKPELYNYIAKGVDEGGKIKKLVDEIKQNNWYTFNLLALSNAEIVTVKETDGLQDYMFAAYDTCITKGARGVYNFSPVRDKSKIVGYSYTDTKTNQYPYDEFPANNEIANISKFVGRPLKDVLATNSETKDFLRNKIDSDKLYKVDDIFTPAEIKNKKIRLQGDYVDSSLKLFFRSNNKGEVIFPKCDCEGSGKPSVLPMWGSCFAVFNVIADDIKLQEFKKHGYSSKEIGELSTKAMKDEKNGYLKGAEYYYNEILKILENEETQNKQDYGILKSTLNFLKTREKYTFTKKLINTLVKQDKYQDAKNVLNSLIDKKVKELFNFETKLPNKILLGYLRIKISLDYATIGTYCQKLGEKHSAKICKWASSEIKHNTTVGREILNRRADGNAYIEDLYDKRQ